MFEFNKNPRASFRFGSNPNQTLDLNEFTADTKASFRKGVIDPVWALNQTPYDKIKEIVNRDKKLSEIELLQGKLQRRDNEMKILRRQVLLQLIDIRTTDEKLRELQIQKILSDTSIASDHLTFLLKEELLELQNILTVKDQLVLDLKNKFYVLNANKIRVIKTLEIELFSSKEDCRSLRVDVQLHRNMSEAKDRKILTQLSEIKELNDDLLDFQTDSKHWEELCSEMNEKMIVFQSENNDFKSASKGLHDTIRTHESTIVDMTIEKASLKKQGEILRAKVIDLTAR